MWQVDLPDNHQKIGDAEETHHGKVDWFRGCDVVPREQTHRKGSGRAGVNQDTHNAEAGTREQMHFDTDNVYHEPAGTSRAEYAEAEFWEGKHGRTPEGHYGVRGAEYEQNEHHIDARPHGRQHTKREMDDDYYYAEEEAEGDEQREYCEPTKHPDYEEDQHEEPTWHKTVKSVFLEKRCRMRWMINLVLTTAVRAIKRWFERMIKGGSITRMSKSSGTGGVRTKMSTDTNGSCSRKRRRKKRGREAKNRNFTSGRHSLPSTS